MVGGEGESTGYTYRCLTRANIDRRRASCRRPEVLLDPQNLPVVAATHDFQMAAEDRLAVLAALQSLPRRQRAVVVLRYLQDLSEADTAAVARHQCRCGQERSRARPGPATR